MPSWNIHIAHAEAIMSDPRSAGFGIEDANAFLFGNYVPDIYVGFMVPDASFHIDYCVTHDAMVNAIPVPNADRFWDRNVARRRPASPAGASLAIGAWAHLVADRYYNGRFRAFCAEHEVPRGEALRKVKQGDFDLFGRSLSISATVDETPELVEAAGSFISYHIAPEDTHRTIEVANAIVRAGAANASGDEDFQLLSPAWLTGVFDECNERIATWLLAWRELEDAGCSCLSADIRAHAQLPLAAPDDFLA